MTKRERVVAALGGQPVERPPVAFGRHAPDVDHTAKGLAEAMLSFHRRFDLDLVKVMSSGVYCVEDWGCRVADTSAPSGAKQCVEHAVRAAADWARVRELDPGGGALGRELEAVRLIVRGRHDDAPVLHTVFTPLTIAKKLAGDRLRDDLRAAPAALPVHAINWHDRLTPPTLGAARRRFAGAAVGGLSEWETLRRGPVRAIADEVDDAIRQTGGRGVIVAPGCVLPLDVPEAHLDAVVDAVKRSRP